MACGHFDPFMLWWGGGGGARSKPIATLELGQTGFGPQPTCQAIDHHGMDIVRNGIAACYELNILQMSTIIEKNIRDYNHLLRPLHY